MDFGLLRREFSKHAAEAQRLFPRRRMHPIAAGGGRVAFVENQIDHFEHRGEPFGAFFAARNFEQNARFAERPLSASERWAIVFSGIRNPRATSSVVRPPRRRRVIATRASGERAGWAGG